MYGTLAFRKWSTIPCCLLLFFSKRLTHPSSISPSVFLSHSQSLFLSFALSPLLFGHTRSGLQTSKGVGHMRCIATKFCQRSAVLSLLFLNVQPLLMPLLRGTSAEDIWSTTCSDALRGTARSWDRIVMICFLCCGEWSSFLFIFFVSAYSLCVFLCVWVYSVCSIHYKASECDQCVRK